MRPTFFATRAPKHIGLQARHIGLQARPTFLAMTPPTAGPTTNPLPTAAPSKDMGRMRAPG